MANASPIIMRKILCNNYAFPLDANILFFDHKPLLGSSKTWRGLIASLLITSASSYILGYSLLLGASISMAAMLGDMLSSFIKRRLKLLPSSQMLFIDQIPEVLLPSLFMFNIFNLSLTSLILLISLFIIFELAISRPLYKYGIRKRPY